jgi:hypothetical protein
MFGNGLIGYAVYKTLQAIGALVFIGAGGYMVYLMLKEDAKAPVAMPLPRRSDIFEAMPRDTCLVFVNIAGVKDVVTLTSGECWAAIGASTHYLDTHIQSEKLEGEKL